MSYRHESVGRGGGILFLMWMGWFRENGVFVTCVLVAHSLGCDILAIDNLHMARRKLYVMISSYPSTSGIGPTYYCF